MLRETIAICIILYTVCTVDSTNSTTTSASGSFTLTTNSTLTVSNSSLFQIELAGNPTTGYQWFLSNSTIINNSYLQCYQCNADYSGYYIADTTSSNTVGSGGKFYFYFNAVQYGTTTLTFLYQQSWVGQPAQIITAQVTVGATTSTSASPVSVTTNTAATTSSNSSILNINLVYLLVFSLLVTLIQ